MGIVGCLELPITIKILLCLKNYHVNNSFESGLLTQNLADSINRSRTRVSECLVFLKSEGLIERRYLWDKNVRKFENYITMKGLNLLREKFGIYYQDKSY